ncbi:hypothetical protein LCGC14_0358380 [marine sediment metagenome]|uniref:Uncharacterized protein n=1 Tax=marine sediment metagenome TaxID=412755 RepID=A0A0F9WGQ8_9ZZZZ|nr:hypothetical protein [Pricia sp.]
MSNRLSELVDKGRRLIAKMEPELELLSPPDQFNVCTELKSIQYALSKIKEIADAKDTIDM